MNTVKELLQLRKKYSALKAVSKYQCIYAEKDKYPYIYKRSDGGQEIAVIINPSERAEICQNVELSGEVIYSVGKPASFNDGNITAYPQSATFILLK